MSDSFYYQTVYTLDKSHYAETYDESATPSQGLKGYLKSIIIMAIGLVLLSLPGVDSYLGAFLFMLGVVEALSVRFHRAWWLARQLISRAANNDLTLTINEQGIESRSSYVTSLIKWQDVKSIEATSRGWLIHHNTGKSYLSNRCLSEQAQQYIRGKSTTDLEIQ